MGGDGLPVDPLGHSDRRHCRQAERLVLHEQFEAHGGQAGVEALGAAPVSLPERLEALGAGDCQCLTQSVDARDGARVVVPAEDARQSEGTGDMRCTGDQLVLPTPSVS